MGSIARGFRFIVGAVMVAAGATLIVPFARIAVDTYAAAGGNGGSTGSPPAALVAPPLQQPAAAGAEAMPPAAALGPAAGWRIPEDALPAPVALRGDYMPPPAPERLPAVPVSLGAEGPALNGNYRSTLAVPPPPLLDAQALPPGAGPVTAFPAAAPPPVWNRSPVMAAGEPPATYVIRDGDDLTGIATRFYGHPAAAAAIWDANRDLVPDPNLLPIGTSLRMPPPWSVPGVPTADGNAARVIEPPRGTVGPAPPAPRAAESPGWLTAAPVASAASPPRPVAGGTVRLAPGETLESLAVRFYGDRSAAARIWEANRDRLRSPDLAVAGMELRLP